MNCFTDKCCLPPPLPITLPCATSLRFNAKQNNIVIPFQTVNEPLNTIGPASKFPIQFTVFLNNLCSSKINGVTLTLEFFTFSYLADLAILLESPNGTTCLLFSVGSGTDNNRMYGVTVTFSNMDPTLLPWNGVSGTFAPNVSSVDSPEFDSPCPAGPYPNTSLDVFKDVSVAESNGTWNLWIQDFTSGDYATLKNAVLTFY